MTIKLLDLLDGKSTIKLLNFILPIGVFCINESILYLILFSNNIFCISDNACKFPFEPEYLSLYVLFNKANLYAF
jgi:hypothetical protein